MKKNKAYVLFFAMLRSTSGINTLKHSKDKKKRGRIISNFIGYGIVYALLICYGAFSSYMMGTQGMGESIPAMCAMSVALITFIFTLLKSNGYLFNFKEYDMIMSMPFEEKTIVACKFMYMYTKGMVLPLAFSLSMLIGYAASMEAGVDLWARWMLLSLVTPLIPTALAAGLAALIARVGSGLRLKKIVQAVLIFALCIFAFAFRYIIEAIIRNGEGEAILSEMANKSDSAKGIYLPAEWFEKAVVDGQVSSLVLLLGMSLMIFVAFYSIIAVSYKKINSGLGYSSEKKKTGKVIYKKRSAVRSIALKEVSRFFSSVTYMTNAGLGQVVIVLLGIASLFFDGDKIVSVITQNSPMTSKMVLPAIPFIVYFLIGMVSTASITPSLEGKNYWILESLPLKKADICKGKMLFNLYASLPFGWFGVTMLAISFRAGLLNWVGFMLCETALCLFSTSYGMLCGIKRIKLEWENEIEVIKQGAAMFLYMFPNMFLTMLFLVVTVILGMIINGFAVCLIFTLFYLLLAWIMYRVVIKE